MKRVREELEVSLLQKPFIKYDKGIFIKYGPKFLLNMVRESGDKK